MQCIGPVTACIVKSDRHRHEAGLTHSQECVAVIFCASKSCGSYWICLGTNNCGATLLYRYNCFVEQTSRLCILDESYENSHIPFYNSLYLPPSRVTREGKLGQSQDQTQMRL